MPATFSTAIIRRSYPRHIGFDGVLISDDISMGALQGSLAERTGALWPRLRSGAALQRLSSPR
jgi:beta-glucosidase-like glycosyl hydrolase